jgi:ubiquinone/menaquinone biosynthesis C-methylase UbiE
MRIIETIVQDLKAYLSGKKVLEIACGDSDFSLITSKYAKEILATDISLERVKRRGLEIIPNNVQFKEMNATNLDIAENSFDVSSCYNALGHLKSILRPVLIEMFRVTNQDGYLIFIATWKMDIATLGELKNIISEYNNLTLFAEIENKKYNALIVKKTI